ncbi:MAG: hypothetical protein CM15mP74_36950 [Halieaceae bacterium]|nr:MAG: hypothetical protein CM15mP74_36950 [Halieaceae bacterium]
MAADCIVICQAAKPGSLAVHPGWDDYDREIVIISTLKLDTCCPCAMRNKPWLYAAARCIDSSKCWHPSARTLIRDRLFCIGASSLADLQ